MATCCSWIPFLSKKSLKNHLRSVAHDTGIPCPTCRACFRNQVLLDKHDRDGYHLVPPRPAPRTNDAEYPPCPTDQCELDRDLAAPRFCCELCGTVCESKLILDEHHHYHHALPARTTPPHWFNVVSAVPPPPVQAATCPQPPVRFGGASSAREVLREMDEHQRLLSKNKSSLEKRGADGDRSDQNSLSIDGKLPVVPAVPVVPAAPPPPTPAVPPPPIPAVPPPPIQAADCPPAQFGGASSAREALRQMDARQQLISKHKSSLEKRGADGDRSDQDTMSFDGHLPVVPAATHSQLPPVASFSCGICRATYASESSLDQHRLFYHRKPANEEPPAQQRAGPPPPIPVATNSQLPPVASFSCGICRATYASASILDQHRLFYHRTPATEEAPAQQRTGPPRPPIHQVTVHPVHKAPTQVAQTPPIKRMPVLLAVQQAPAQQPPREASPPPPPRTAALPAKTQLQYAPTLPARTLPPCITPITVQPVVRQAPTKPVHTPPPQFHCAPCDRDFKHQRGLTSHLNSQIHNFRCDACGIDCGDRSSLSRHKRSRHGSTPAAPPRRPPVSQFHCIACTRDFPNQASLDSHLASSLHRWQLGCDLCPGLFNTLQELDQHRAKAHPRAAARTSDPRKVERVPPVNCTLCKRSFVNQYALDQHLVSNAHVRMKGK